MPSCPQSRLPHRSVHVNASERARGPSDYSLTTSEAPIDRALASGVHVNAWSFERGAPVSSALAMLATLACWVMLSSRAAAGSEDVRTLHEARDFLKEFALDTRESTETRRDAISALGRVHEALNDWGEAGQLEWYLDMLAKGLPGEVQGALAATAQSVAKARQHHLGGVRRFWRDLEAIAKEKNRPLVDEVREARSHFHKTARALDREGGFAPNIKPFSLTMPTMNLAESLKPYPEEPKK